MIVLEDTELVNVTKRDRPRAQARVLRLLGIPFTVHPTDGVLLVSRSAAEAVLGGLPAPAGQGEQQHYGVNVEGIKLHGKASSAR